MIRSVTVPAPAIGPEGAAQAAAVAHGHRVTTQARSHGHCTVRVRRGPLALPGGIVPGPRHDLANRGPNNASISDDT
jgi:hypothetical protein